MRIAIDASCWHNNRGFGRFTRELVSAMIRSDQNNEYVLLTDDELSIEKLGGAAETIRVHAARRVIDSATFEARRGLRDVLAFRRAAAAARPDMLFFPAVYSWFPPPRGLPNVVTFHDAIAEHFPELVFPSWRQRLPWMLKTKLANKAADRLLTVSQSAKREIIKFLKIPAERIDVICEGAAPVFAPVTQKSEITPALKAAGLTPGTRFFTYVGGFAPHKNLVRLLQAFEQLLAEPDLSDLTIVLVGDPKGGGFHSIYDDLRSLVMSSSKLAERVRFPGYLSDAELAAIYTETVALVLPSLSEGFGLPALEAMSCGAAVLGAKRGAVLEVAGSAGIGFDPYDQEDIACAIKRVAQNSALLAGLRANAIPETSRNTWTLAAGLTIAALERCAEKGGAKRTTG